MHSSPSRKAQNFHLIRFFVFGISSKTFLPTSRTKKLNNIIVHHDEQQVYKDIVFSKLFQWQPCVIYEIEFIQLCQHFSKSPPFPSLKHNASSPARSRPSRSGKSHRWSSRAHWRGFGRLWNGHGCTVNVEGRWAFLWKLGKCYIRLPSNGRPRGIVRGCISLPFSFFFDTRIDRNSCYPTDGKVLISFRVKHAMHF